MFKRKKKLIDKRFQLKSVFTIIVITSVLMVSVILVISVITAGNKRLMHEAADSLSEAIEMENRIVSSFIQYEQSKSGSSLIIKTDAVKNDHEKAVNNIKDYVSQLLAAVEKNYYVIAGILLLFFFQSIIFCFYLIRFTHRIAGPVHVMTEYMEKILNGEKPVYRKLRDNDELLEFHTRFIETMTLFEKKENEKSV